MKLLIKERLFSWFDSYDVYNADNLTEYTVQGQLAWGHCLKIYDKNQNEIGMVKEVILTWLPKFELYLSQRYIGSVERKLSFFTPQYSITCNNWYVKGDILGWNYTVYDRNGRTVATVSKQLLNWTDTYVIDVKNPEDALVALMLVIAIDAEACSRKK